MPMSSPLKWASTAQIAKTLNEISELSAKCFQELPAMNQTDLLTIFGIVIAGIGLIAAVVIGVWQITLAKKQNQIVVQQHTVTADYRLRPYPAEIIGEIDKLPALNRESAGESYVGLKVEWNVSLHSVSKSTAEKPGFVRLSLLDRGNYPWIYCEVELEKYPELKLLKEGKRLRVIGEIAEVGSNTIQLKNVTLKLE